ncbi:MAG: DUF1223 domain-containing protein [Planctomycetota bacterium]
MKLTILIVLVGSLALLAFGATGEKSDTRRPVIVELFTSEGCSSCPPAEAVLNDLHQGQPIDGVDVIAIAWHVTYWDDLGWVDPLGDRRFTKRQREYARTFGRGNVYTPQMIVGGTEEFVGSNRSRAASSIASAAEVDPIHVTITSNDHDVLCGTVEGVEGPITLVVVEDGLTSKVQRGENRGKTLTHDGVARTFDRVEAGAFEIAVPSDVNLANARLVAFAQSDSLGPITAVGVAGLE